MTNKDILTVYDKPMIYYPILTLVNAGIEDIILVAGGNSAGDFLKLLGHGKAFGLKRLNYTYKVGGGGIAGALSPAEHFAAVLAPCVVPGDNIFEGNICSAVRSFKERGGGAKIILKQVLDPERLAYRNWMASGSVALRNSHCRTSRPTRSSVLI